MANEKEALEKFEEITVTGSIGGSLTGKAMELKDFTPEQISNLKALFNKGGIANAVGSADVAASWGAIQNDSPEPKPSIMTTDQLNRAELDKVRAIREGNKGGGYVVLESSANPEGGHKPNQAGVGAADQLNQKVR